MLMLQSLKMPFRQASRVFSLSILQNRCHRKNSSSILGLFTFMRPFIMSIYGQILFDFFFSKNGSLKIEKNVFFFVRSISQRFPYRGYAKTSDCKDGRLTRNTLEEEESLSSQSWRSYIVPTAVLFFIGAGAFIHYNDEKRAIPKGSERSTGIGKADTNKPAIGGPFKLFDAENHLVTESNLRGNWILLYFGYTSSPDVGPAEVDKMAKAIDILESQHNLKVKPIYITIDPQRDSPDQLKAYLCEFDSRITGLTGPISAVRQIAQEYRVFFKKVDEEGQDYLVESSHDMYLLDPNMDTVRWFGAEYDASQLADGILYEVQKATR